MNKAILTLMAFIMLCIGAFAEGKDTVGTYGTYYCKAWFPGGPDSMQKFMKSRLHYPAAARENGIMGRVIISFWVLEDGSMYKPEVERGIGTGCDQEALRIVKAMPPWGPATLDGKPVRAMQTVEVLFRLD